MEEVRCWDWTRLMVDDVVEALRLDEPLGYLMSDFFFEILPDA